MGRRIRLGGAVAVVLAMLAVGVLWQGGAAPSSLPVADGRLRVATTTEILADFASQVGGSDVAVSPLVPPGDDPHSYEPTASDAARIANADVTFTNHLLLERHALIKAIDAGVRDGVPNVSLAEQIETYGGSGLTLVEDLNLDVPWLGLMVRGDGRQFGATRSSEVRMRATALEGPGRLVAYLVEKDGRPDVLFDSADGFDEDDVTTLPPAAHTHFNWVFTRPGVYRLTLESELVNPDGKVHAVKPGTFTFAVGVDPRTATPASEQEVVDDGHRVRRGPVVMKEGHGHVTVDLDEGAMVLLAAFADVHESQDTYPPEKVVVEVSNRALEVLQPDPRLAFLGPPGTRIHQLPQGVIGRHVHGEIDPHVWEDVSNAQAYVQLIRDALIRADPEHEAGYRARTARYLRRLRALDTYIAAQVAKIPDENRELVTTHNAFSYLANAYGLEVVGFVVPNPAQQPSASQVQELSETVANLVAGSVFIEPNLAQRAAVLRQVAEDNGVQVCKLYGDAFDDQAPNYEAMMRHNADELLRCLGGRR